MIPFNRDWRFYRGDITAPSQRGFTKAGRWVDNGAARNLDDSEWQTVHLPHDFMFEGDFTPAPVADELSDIPAMGTIDSLHSSRGSLSGGVAWYRKHFSLPPSARGKRIYVRFGGAGRDAVVYINQFRVTSHLDGFLDFCADVSDLVAFEQENILAVRVDSTETEGWWYQGGGLYRNVWLDIREPVHLSYDSLWVCPEVDPVAKRAAVKVSADVENHTSLPAHRRLSVSVFDPDGAPVHVAREDVTVGAMDRASAHVEFTLDGVSLWDCEHPNLYRVVASLAGDGADDSDSAECRVGFRQARFDRDRGFLLNGVPTKLRGVCVHQGHACVGSGEFDGLHEYKLQKLKDMGANAYRTSHNPVSRELLDACDRMGMLVMDETRLMSTGNEDRAIFEQMIRRDRNHPSVILWSVGNEEIGIQFAEQAAPICRTMTAIAHKLDPTRPTTEALLFWDIENKRLRENVEIAAPVADNVDVVGINYGLPVWQKLRAAFPDKPFVATEIGSINSTRGAVVRNDALCQVSLSHSIGKGEDSWRLTAENDFCAGMFLWTGFDYYGEPTPFTYPAVIGAFGILDACGFPKYSYPYYLANWRPELDVFWLCPHWNPVKGGERRCVYLFSRCDEAELFVNGVSVGRKSTRPYSHAEWQDVEFVPGEITAVGYRNGVEVHRKTVATTGPAVALRADVEHLSTDANRFTWAIIKLSAVDGNGEVVPTAAHPIHISTGEGTTLAGSGNGDPICHENAKADIRSLFCGLAQVILRRDAALPQACATFSSEGLGSVTVEF